MSEIEETMKRLGYNKDQAKKYLEISRNFEKKLEESRQKAGDERRLGAMSQEIYVRKMALIDQIERDFQREDQEFQEKTDKINERINELLTDETVKNFTVTFSKNEDGSIDAGFFVLADKSKHSKEHMMRKVSRALKEEKAENNQNV